MNCRHIAPWEAYQDPDYGIMVWIIGVIGEFFNDLKEMLHEFIVHKYFSHSALEVSHPSDVEVI